MKNDLIVPLHAACRIQSHHAHHLFYTLVIEIDSSEFLLICESSHATLQIMFKDFHAITMARVRVRVRVHLPVHCKACKGYCPYLCG